MSNQNNQVNFGSGKHFVLLYEKESERDHAMQEYIGQGLKNNQLCIYASLRTSERSLSAVFEDKTEFNENIKRGNLLIVDLKTSYMSILHNDLSPFEEFREKIMEKVQDRRNKLIRFVCDLGGALFGYMHFEQCIKLEEWLQNKPMSGSYMCPYDKHVFDKSPYMFRKNDIFDAHDMIITC